MLAHLRKLLSPTDALALARTFVATSLFALVVFYVSELWIANAALFWLLITSLAISVGIATFSRSKFWAAVEPLVDTPAAEPVRRTINFGLVASGLLYATVLACDLVARIALNYRSGIGSTWFVPYVVFMLLIGMRQRVTVPKPPTSITTSRDEMKPLHSVHWGERIP